MSRETPKSFILNPAAFTLILLCLIQTACMNTPSDEQHKYVTLKKSLNAGRNKQIYGNREGKPRNNGTPRTLERTNVENFHQIETHPTEEGSRNNDNNQESLGLSKSIASHENGDQNHSKIELRAEEQVINQPTTAAVSSSIKPDSFKIKLKEVKHSNSKKYFVLVHITPGSKGMRLEEFSITASVVEDRGELKGVGSRKKSGKGFQYNTPISNTDPISLTELYVISSNCLGKDDTTFESGNTAIFKLNYTPNGQQRDKYQLAVTVERKGSNTHSETEEIFLLPK